MPDKQDEQIERTKISPAIRKIASSVQSNIDALYSKTYFSSPSTRSDLTVTKNRINKSIDNIIANNINMVAMPSITSLYSRLNSYKKDPAANKALQDIFTDKTLMDGLMNSYMENRFLRDYDQEIDTVLKYCPVLLEALAIRRDNVLSADHFSKDFINVDESSNIEDSSQFIKRCNDIKDKYDLIEKYEDWYDRAAKYGETFVYIVPYRQAIAKLLSMKQPFNPSASTIDVGQVESAILQETTISISETTFKDGLKSIGAESSYFKEGGSVNIKVEFNMSGILLDDIRNACRYINESAKIESLSLNSQLLKEVTTLKNSLTESEFSAIQEEKSTTLASMNTFADYTKRLNPSKMDREPSKPVTSKSKRELDKGFSLKSDDSTLDYDIFTKDKDDTSPDGLINPNDHASDLNKDPDKIKLKTPGAVVKELDRYNIIPLYIEDLCLGYYYIEFNDKTQYMINSQLADPTISLKSSTKLYNNQEMIRQDNMLRYISSKIASEMDARFVNTNQDLAKEIYMILKYNETYNTPNPEGIRVTFLSPDDVEHIHFKLNPKSHRGISDLEPALFPAKMYSGLYITNVIAMMTRGQDRRIYYVKQAVDTNVAEVLLNVIEQIKKNNFNIRQIENINQVLNILGRFNDFVIPTGPNGDAPVQFEVMQGQDIDPQTDMMQNLKELALNSIETPLELVQARQSVDYAIMFTMTNSKFLRTCYRRQAKFQPFMGRIFSKIYNAEYFENVSIKITLPPPSFLNITNMDQFTSNIQNLSQNIADIMLPDGDESDPDAQYLKNTYFSKVRRMFLKSFVDFNKMDQLLSETKQEIKSRYKPQEQQ